MIDIENYCVCKQRYMNEEVEELIKEMKEYRNGMVARNLPFQWISDIITKWEMKQVKTVSEKLQDELEPITDEIDQNDIKDFYEETQKEKKELEDSYQESVRQTKERK